jgi:hypothetical protein
MVKVSTLKGYGKVKMVARRIREAEGWEIIQTEGAVFDATTADLMEELPSYLECERVDQHILESGDEVLVPLPRGWLLARVR